jgi:hypothetical protein
MQRLSKIAGTLFFLRYGYNSQDVKDVLAGKSWAGIEGSFNFLPKPSQDRARTAEP